VLQTAWHALEDAGINPLSLSGRSVGVYMGAVGQEYALCGKDKGEKASPYTITGVINSLIANRLSYILDVHGPSTTIDTACSSSLIAVHDAICDLRLGNCSMALVGGVNLILGNESSEALRASGLLSDSCKSFDADADGFCRGEGCGVVVMKRLSHALSAGDRIYAVIRGSAVNHDGKGSGMTVPNTLAQEELLRAAYRNAGVEPMQVRRTSKYMLMRLPISVQAFSSLLNVISPSCCCCCCCCLTFSFCWTWVQVRYIEAMGTGSKMGDSMELAALGAVIGVGRDASDPKQRCLVSSCKANLGHLEAAGGVMSLIRASLILYHNLVPRALHIKTITNIVALDQMSLSVPLVNTPLVTAEERLTNPPAVVGVSAFGIGGANAHVVLEAPPLLGQLDDTCFGISEVSNSA